MRLWPLAFIVAILGIVFLEPFKGLGERVIGPGGGDLLNGTVSLVLLLLVGVFSIFAAQRRKGGTE